MNYRLGRNLFLTSFSMFLTSLLMEQIMKINKDIIIILSMAVIITGFHWVNVMFGSNERKHYLPWIGSIATTLVSVIVLTLVSAQEGNVTIYHAYLIAAGIQLCQTVFAYAMQKMDDLKTERVQRGSMIHV